MGGPKVTPVEIEQQVAELRDNRCRLADRSGRSLQDRAVSALSAIAKRWRDPDYSIRRQAERENAGFPFAAVWQSLEPLLASFSEEALSALIESEQARGIAGPDVVGHVIASNTPLLAWTSVARALLVQSASLVKLPSHPSAAWAVYFLESLSEADEGLAQLVRLTHWQGGDAELDHALCLSCDLVVAYGSDQAISALEKLCAQHTRLLAYGHRVSFGLVTARAEKQTAAEGFAKDILLYDQGGCLSPQCLFVEGDFADAVAFAGLLAQALDRAGKVEGWIDLAQRSDRARAARLREARELASMEAGTRIWEDRNLDWTVIAVPDTGFRGSCTHGVVYLVPFQGKYRTDGLAGMRAHLQGAGIAAGHEREWNAWADRLAGIGLSYVCRAGEMQRPPLSWRQNGLDILRSLVG